MNLEIHFSSSKRQNCHSAFCFTQRPKRHLETSVSFTLPQATHHQVLKALASKSPRTRISWPFPLLRSPLLRSLLTWSPCHSRPLAYRPRAARVNSPKHTSKPVTPLLRRPSPHNRTSGPLPSLVRSGCSAPPAPCAHPCSLHPSRPGLLALPGIRAVPS